MKNRLRNPAINCGAKYALIYPGSCLGVLALVLVLLTALCSPGWSVGGYSRSRVANLGIGNPVGPATVPQSGIQSGLVRSPNPVDSSGSLGNMIITGNVQAGKHFRGTVPYGSTTDFRAPLGSTSLDSFLRYSAGSDDDGGLTEAYRPFYSPTGTVSTIRLGQPAPDLSWPASTKIRTNAEMPWSGRPDDELAVQDVPAAQNPPAGRAGDSFDMLPVRFQPMARTPQELERLISADLERAAAARSLSPFLQSQAPSEQSEESLLRRPDASPSAQQGDSLTSAQYRDQMEQLQRQLKRISDEAAGLRQSMQAPPLPRQGEQGQPVKSEGRAGLKSQVDIFEQLNRQDSPAEIRAKLDSLLASASQQQPKQSPPELSQSTVPFDKFGAGSAEELPGTRSLVRQTDGGLAGDQQLMTRGTADYRLAAEIGIEQSRDREGAATGDRRQKADDGRAMSLTALQEVNKLSAAELSAEAKRALGGHQDYNSYSANKFQQYASAGQEYLKQGKYYRAVDAYTLASIYKPGPAGSLRQREAAALVHAAKSLALFAAGEYMSSALFLGRALQTDQSSIFNFQFSIPADKLDSRIADAEECLRLCREAGYQTGGVGELQFLLGYIYLRTGRLAEAKRAISEACEKLPDAPAVIALKKAVDQAIARQKTAK